MVCPRPEGETSNQFYQWFVSVDGTRNAFPSLHCALTLYHLLFVGRVLSPGLSLPSRALLTATAALWTAAICYSTLATRQHYFVDIPAGLVLAGFAHFLFSKGESHDRQY